MSLLWLLLGHPSELRQEFRISSHGPDMEQGLGQELC